MSLVWLRRLGARFESRAILLLLVSSLLAVGMIGVVGMSASVLVAESVQGSGSAINLAGSLRRFAHRAGSMAAAAGLGGRIGATEVEDAIAQFDGAILHPDLIGVLGREESAIPAAIHRGVVAAWRDELKPRLSALGTLDPTLGTPAQYTEALAEIDVFVAQINTLVTILEQDAEASIQRLRTTLAAALIMTALVVALSLQLMRRRVFRPLAELGQAAGRIARRDFTIRSELGGNDELGQVSAAFNAMADELSVAYRDLEQRVEHKTAALVRTNRSLELLYNVISRLYHAPASAEAYAEALTEIERTLGLKGSFACIQPKHGGPSAVLFSTMGRCVSADQDADEACRNCRGKLAPWTYQPSADAATEVLMVPLRDADHLYGMLRFALPRGQRLAPWQQDLVEAVSRHMGVALGITRQSERERLLGLQEERSIIARELHDSLAQSLSYMKIQVSLLAPVVTDPARRDEALAVLSDLRQGLDAAYRQLRELLSSFRLQINGDFSRLLASTVDEFSNRSGIPITLALDLASCELRPNQEVHLLHLIREALSNATRHASASHIRVDLRVTPGGWVELVVEDDGDGAFATMPAEPHHYGMAIMAERANGLGGTLTIKPTQEGGTRVAVRFDPQGETRAITEHQDRLST